MKRYLLDGKIYRTEFDARWGAYFKVGKIKAHYIAYPESVIDSHVLPGFYLEKLKKYFFATASLELPPIDYWLLARQTGKDVIAAVGQPPEPDDLGLGKSAGFEIFFADPESPANFDNFYCGRRDLFLECESCGLVSLMNEDYSTMKGVCGNCEKARMSPQERALTAWYAAKLIELVVED